MKLAAKVVVICLGTFLGTHSSANTMKNSLSPKDAIIIFDIHGVLCTPNIPKMLSLFWNSPCKFTMIRHALYPRVWYRSVQFWRRHAVAGTYVKFLEENYPSLKPCVPLIVDIANAQHLNEEVFTIIKKLKAQGYTLHILSNIDEQFWRDLKTTPCGVMLDYFEVVKGTSANTQGKPHADIYHEYIQEHNPGQKKMVFIDNRQPNIEGAKKAGMIGIHFKNANQLEKELHQLGVLL